MAHSLTLNNHSAHLLAAVLSNGKHFKTAKDTFRSALFQETYLQDLPEFPKDGKDLPVWAITEWKKFEITETQRDLLKHTLEAAAGDINPAPALVSLFTQLGLDE